MSEEVDAGQESGAGFRFRDTTRAPFTTTTRLRFDRLGGEVSAETADISMEGMFVKTEEPRPVGTLVQFEFDLEQGESVQGLGDVVWVRAHSRHNKPAGMGIQFRYVDPRSREHVHRIVSDFISQLGGSKPGPSIPMDGPEEERPSPMGTVAVPLSSLPGLNDPARPLGDLVDPASERPGSTGSEAGAGAESAPAEKGTRSDSGIDPNENPFGSLLDTGASSPPQERGTSGSISGAFSLAVAGPGRVDSPSVKAPPMRFDSPADRRDEDRELSGELFGEPESGEASLESLEGALPGVEPYDGSTDLSNYDIYARGASTERRSPLAGVLIVLVLLLAVLAWVFKPWEHWAGSEEQDDVPQPAAAADTTVAGDSAPGDDSAEEGEGPPPEDPAGATAPREEGTETDSGTGEAPPLPSADPPVSVAEAPPPSRLTALDAVDGEGQTLVRIAADRALQEGGYSSLRLDGPPRFVLKIQGVSSPLRSSSSGRLFRSVRSGIHAGPGGEEIHLVFDMRTAAYEADAEVVDGQLLVTFR